MVSEEEGLRQARMEGKPAMIDFGHRGALPVWNLRRLRMPTRKSLKELKKFVNIKIDCTNTNDPKIKQLWEKYRDCRITYHRVHQ